MFTPVILLAHSYARAGGVACCAVTAKTFFRKEATMANTQSKKIAVTVVVAAVTALVVTRGLKK